MSVVRYKPVQCDTVTPILIEPISAEAQLFLLLLPISFCLQTQPPFSKNKKTIYNTYVPMISVCVCVCVGGWGGGGGGGG